MGHLDTLDLVIFISALVGILLFGMWVGRKEDNTQDFFLAGKSVGWVGIAGSLLGTNWSAAQLVGLMGASCSLGLATALYPTMAVVGVIFLMYVFMPIFEDANIYTLSQYLEARYDSRVSNVFSLLSIVVTIILGLIFAFYFGGRSLSELLGDTPLEMSYTQMVILLAVVTGIYTVTGGLSAVIYTDVMQTLLLVAGGAILAVLVLMQPEIGGLAGLLELDALQPVAERKLTIFKPSNHPQIPWTGALTGLLLLNIYFYGGNQVMAQRMLAAKSPEDGRLGILVSIFIKVGLVLLVILPGIAGYYILKARGLDINPDDIFATLFRTLVPVGYGFGGIIMVGLIGGVLSTVDSVLNTGSTFLTIDYYKKYFRKDASEKELVKVGRIFIVILLILGTSASLLLLNPESTTDGFLKSTQLGSYLTVGILTIFLFGILWKPATASAALVVLIISPFLSWGYELLYNNFLVIWFPGLVSVFSDKLNFFHQLILTFFTASLLFVIISKLTEETRNQENEKHTLGEVLKRSERKTAPFWKSEKPWVVLLVVITSAFLIWFR
jgi:SSS family solute:Na+ symporter